MSDTTITPEERRLLRTGGYGDYERLRLLDALEQAEAEVARLRQLSMTAQSIAEIAWGGKIPPTVEVISRLSMERDWLATQLACIQSAYDIDQKTRDWSTARWAEAARRAVADSESEVKG